MHRVFRVASLTALSLFAIPPSVSAALDPLTMRWTFGNHEPIAMYRRVGGKADGTPEIALPLEGQIGETRRYAIGKVKVE